MAEKHDKWEEIKIDVPKPIAVTLMTRTIDGTLFGAARVYVTLFGTEVRCVALRAGDEKHIIQPELGPDWLVERGLDRKTAEAIVEDAMDLPEEGERNDRPL